MNVNLNLGDTQLIIKEGKEQGLLRNQLAYVLATTYHETVYKIKPVRETLAQSDEKAVLILDNAYRKGQLKWVKTPYWRFDEDGKSWLGRGYVQLTWKKNYEKVEKELNLDVVDNPNLVMIPEVAVKVLVAGMKNGWFTGKKLSDYITLQESNFREARYIINGTDRRDTIAFYAQSYDKALKESGYGEEVKNVSGQISEESSSNSGEGNRGRGYKRGK